MRLFLALIVGNGPSVVDWLEDVLWAATPKAAAAKTKMKVDKPKSWCGCGGLSPVNWFPFPTLATARVLKVMSVIRHARVRH